MAYHRVNIFQYQQIIKIGFEKFRIVDNLGNDVSKIIRDNLDTHGKAFVFVFSPYKHLNMSSFY
jgi:hypothetical protein